MLPIRTPSNDFFCSCNPFLGRTVILCALLAYLSFGTAQILPQNQAKLNYTQVLFQWETVVNADQYIVEITDKTENKTFLTDTFPLSGTIIHHLMWQHKYEWKVTAYSFGKKVLTTPTRTFEILYNYKVNPNRYRHKIIKNSLQFDSLYIILDNPGIIIDLKGNPIWFYPDTNVARVFNLQLLHNGDVVALKPNKTKSANENLAFEELTLDGKAVWKAPDKGEVSGDSSEHYHHDFQVLSNGHYLIVGNQFFKQDIAYIKYGTVMEYDTSGKVVWSWNSKDYLKLEDLTAEGVIDRSAHLNAIYLDEKRDQLWISFRYLDRIIVLDRKTKKVLHSYGSKLPSGDAELANGLFRKQHSCQLVGKNKDVLMLYDNRTGKGTDTLSYALMLDINQNPVKERYRFPMQFPGRRQGWSESKGDIDQITDSLFLIEMGSFPRTVILDTTKGFVWQCDNEVKSHPESPWTMEEESYRAHFTRTLYPQHWNLTIGVGKKMNRKIANYPLVVYDFGVKGEYEIFIFDNKNELALHSEGIFTDKQNYQFTTVELPRRAKKGKPIGYLVVCDKKTKEVYFRTDILKR